VSDSRKSFIPIVTLLAVMSGGTVPRKRASLPVGDRENFIPLNCLRIPKNWSGPDPLCTDNHELLKTEHMELGVLIKTRNPILARKFRHGMDFWTTVLDMSWHEVGDPKDCAIEIVDASKPDDLKRYDYTALAQQPDWRGFQGQIAVDPTTRLTRMREEDMVFHVAAHEIGHLLGLKHNPNPRSLMYADNMPGTQVLDSKDLAALAARHKLRPGIDPGTPVNVVYARARLEARTQAFETCPMACPGK
jgi:Matrixin